MIQNETGFAASQSIQSTRCLSRLRRCIAVFPIRRPRALGVTCHLYFPATPYGAHAPYPLNRVVFRNKTLDYFRFAMGHRISTPQPDPGFFRAAKVGRCSDILPTCAPVANPIQASLPATIKAASWLGPQGRGWVISST
jgi:hypothetical protein